MFINDTLFCCLSQEKQDRIKTDIDRGDYRTIYLNQKNLIEEKNGYRCNQCGKFYPFLTIEYQNKSLAPEAISKIKRKPMKHKKTSDIFCGDHYYAQSKRTLQRYELTSNGSATPTDEFPISVDLFHAIISQEDRYVAIENFSGTIEIIDTNSKSSITKKKNCKINGAFIFSKEKELLYFENNAIKRWDFEENAENETWSVPLEWIPLDDGKALPCVCNNIIYNSTSDSYLFQCSLKNKTYAVFIKNNKPIKTVLLPQIPTLCKLIYVKELNIYTFVSNDQIYICDEEFKTIESFPYPDIIHISNGGGLFPITRQSSGYPIRTFLSPDGRWILLDYFNYVFLMDHKDYTLKHCIYSYTGKAVNHIGFLDSNRFWYTWGNSTYIQEIDE